MFKSNLSGAALCVALFTAGCETNVAPPLNVDGRFATAARLTAADILIVSKFDKVRYGRLALVENETPSYDWEQFFSSALKNSGLFDAVHTPLTAAQAWAANGDPRAGQPTSIRDRLGLDGPYLVVRTSAFYRGDVSYEVTLTAIDSQTGQTVFFARRRGAVFASVTEFFRPVLNAFLDWAHDIPPPPISSGQAVLSKGH